MTSISQNPGVTVINSVAWTGYGYFFKLKGDRGVVLNETGGSLTATATYGTALILESGGSVTNQVEASITANTGIFISGGFGLVTNAGAIASHVGEADRSVGVILEDGGRVDNQATGTIETASPADGVGVQIDGARGEVENFGRIDASGEQSVGVWLEAGGTVTNFGAISDFGADASLPEAISTTGVAVQLSKGGAIVNRSSASIAGARYGIYARGGRATITNAGTISAFGDAIKFAGSGANKLTLMTGSVINGDVIGSTAKGATNTLELVGSGSTNSPFLNFETLDVEAAGQWSLGGAQAFGATKLKMGVLAVGGSLTTTIEESASTSVAIAADAALDLNGASTLSGFAGGAGNLAMIAGVTTIASGAALKAATWSITSATALLDEALSYAGAFEAGAGAVVADAGGSLTLMGSATFAGATTSGGDALIDDAETSVMGMTIGGMAGFVNEGSLTESARSVTLGDAQGQVVTLVNNAGAAWNFIDDNGIALGKSTMSAISNHGLIEKTGGSGVSVIAPAVDNAGALLVDCGVLDLTGTVTGTGVDNIVGAATLEFDACVASTQTVAFSGSGGVLDLGAQPMFAGVLGGFDTVGSHDAVELLGSWTLDSYSQSSAAQGTLMLSDATQTIKLKFDGSYLQQDFFASPGSGRTLITYHTITQV